MIANDSGNEADCDRCGFVPKYTEIYRKIPRICIKTTLELHCIMGVFQCVPYNFTHSVPRFEGVAWPTVRKRRSCAGARRRVRTGNHAAPTRCGVVSFARRIPTNAGACSHLDTANGPRATHHAPVLRMHGHIDRVAGIVTGRTRLSIAPPFLRGHIAICGRTSANTGC